MSNRHESRKSKGKRYFLGAMIAIVVILALVPFFAWTGQQISIAQGQQPVLSPQSVATYIFTPNGSGVAFAQTNQTTTWTEPANVITVYVKENVTVAAMQSFSVSELNVSFGTVNITHNVTIGFGNSSSDFVAEEYVHSNASYMQVSISPASMTGNQSNHLMLEIQSNATSYTLRVTALGNTGLLNSFGPAAAEDIGYVITALSTSFAIFLVAPWHDISFTPGRAARRIRQHKQSVQQYRQKKWSNYNVRKSQKQQNRHNNRQNRTPRRAQWKTNHQGRSQYRNGQHRGYRGSYRKGRR